MPAQTPCAGGMTPIMSADECSVAAEAMGMTMTIDPHVFAPENLNTAGCWSTLEHGGMLLYNAYGVTNGCGALGLHDCRTLCRGERPYYQSVRSMLL